MEQTIEDLLDRLQKQYQIQSVELDELNQGIELRKTALVLVHLKDVTEIADFESNKLIQFLNGVCKSSTFNVGLVPEACSVIRFSTHPAMKTGKRYQDALQMMNMIKNIAADYEEETKDLGAKKEMLEKDIESMTSLSNLVAKKVVVENIEDYISLLNSKVYSNDDRSVLMAVAAIVRRNADIMISGTVEEVIEFKISEDDQETLNTYEEMVDANKNRYQTYESQTVTNSYLKNIASLVETKKISLSEAKEMLNTNEEMYEYFLWSWMNNLIVKSKRISDRIALVDILNNLAIASNEYKEMVNEVIISEDDSIVSEVKLVYNTFIGPQTIHAESMTDETIDLLKQLKDTDLKENGSVTLLDDDTGIIVGDSDYLLFKVISDDYIFVITNGSVESMPTTLNGDFLNVVMNDNTYKVVKNIINNKGKDFMALMKSNELVEARIMKEEA